MQQISKKAFTEADKACKIHSFTNMGGKIDNHCFQNLRTN